MHKTYTKMSINTIVIFNLRTVIENFLVQIMFSMMADAKSLLDLAFPTFVYFAVKLKGADSQLLTRHALHINCLYECMSDHGLEKLLEKLQYMKNDKNINAIS